MKVLVTHHIPDAGLRLLRGRDLEVTVLPDGAKRKDIIRALRRGAYDGMISLLTDPIDGEVLDAVGDNMRVIANYAVGYNNIMIEEAKERGIAVTNTPGVLTDTVAEHTVALICAVATRIVEADSFMRRNKFTGWEPELFLGMDLRGKTIGILGAGRIGSRVAEIAVGFGMRVIYHDMRNNEELEKAVNAEYCRAPEDLLRTADVVSVHLPLNEATHHFLNGTRLAYMKKTAILVNTSRGPVIDETALTAMLRDGKIFGAGLDVFENEPKTTRALRSLPNVTLTPHIASASIATRNRMAEMAANNVIAVLHGGEPINPV